MFKKKSLSSKLINFINLKKVYNLNINNKNINLNRLIAGTEKPIYNFIIKKNEPFQYSEFFWKNDNYLNQRYTSYTYISSNCMSLIYNEKYIYDFKFNIYFLYLNLYKKIVFNNLIFYDSVFEGTLNTVIPSRSHNKLVLNNYLPKITTRFVKINFNRALWSKSFFNKKKKHKKNIINKTMETNKKYFLNYKKCSIINNKKKYYHYKKKLEILNLKYSLKNAGFPIANSFKKSFYFLNSKMNREGNYKEINKYAQYIRHPNAQMSYIKKLFSYGTHLDHYFSTIYKTPIEDLYVRLYKISWRYFKFKIERFFYRQLGIRLHIWFLNIWDIFLNGIDSLWKWYRYESKTVYYLTRKGQRYMLADRETAKFYVRTMTLTITMAGGVKLFLDKVSILMKKHRNNWAFILNTTKSLRFCINFFWFRFFINYKISLQGKIGGFLRAQKKYFKKGNITIEDKSVLITYYRGFPVTRFGTYNLSFWLQYRIPNLIEKFGDMEYIDTMKILLSMYSVPWLATRLSVIISKMLKEHADKIKKKIKNYTRRIRFRKIVLIEALKTKKYFYKGLLPKNKNSDKYLKIRSILIKKKIKNKFNKNYKKYFYKGGRKSFKYKKNAS